MASQYFASSAFTRTIVGHASQCGLPASDLLTRAGISEHLLNLPSRRIAAHLVERLWQECESAGANRYFGCGLINSMATSTLQGLNILLDSAATLRGSLECVARYSAFVTNYVHLHLDQDGSCARLHIRPTQDQPHFFGLDAATLSLVRNMSRRVGLTVDALFSEVSLSPRQASGDLLNSWNVRVGHGEYTCLHMPLELLDLPLLGANEFLHQSLSRQWYPSDQKDSAGRSLHLARVWLTSGEESVERISERLGYQRSSSFIRAFQKQYGITPKQFRLSSHK